MDEGIEKFKKAPITEALLDIRAQLPNQIDLARLATFQDAVKERYPTKRERVSWQFGFQVKPETAPDTFKPSGGPDGYLFISSDEKQLVQARLDGFTFNRLRPYDRWESFRDEAKRLWQYYVRVGTPERITRLALRYINKIEAPLPIKDLKDYILTTPEIAPELPQSLDGFFMRLVVPETNLQAVAIITLTMEPVKDSKVLPLIFDIDVFRQVVFNSNDNEIWDTMEKLRDLKNRIFFKSITEKTKELIR